MAIGIVQEIKFNVQKESKSGKKYTVTQLKYTTEKGQVKTENCFSDVKFADVLKTLAAGDKIDAKYTKNGEFFNLVDVTLVEKGSGVAPSVPTKSGSSYKEDPEKQAAIIRQNALTNAVNFVTADTVVATLKGDKSKLSADILADLVVAMARKFESYTAGDLDLAEAMTEVAISEASASE